MPQVITRAIESHEKFEYIFSLCTLVSNLEEYNEMLSSFVSAGFTADKCEYIYVNNAQKNEFDAYCGINRFLREAKGKYLIICHQDIVLAYDGADELINRIEEVEAADANWAVLGNAGGVNLKHLSLYVVQSDKPMLYETIFPLKTMTLDENFLVVKNAANLALSGNLSGFHFYGTDICLIADILGYNAYIINFKLLHKSLGTVDERYADSCERLMTKYNYALRSRFLRTPFTRFCVSGSKLIHLFGNMGLVMFLARKYYQLFKTVKSYQLKNN